MWIIVRIRGSQVKFKTLFPFFLSLSQITLIMDIEICNLSNIYPRRYCSVACMLISILKKTVSSKVYTKFICKVNIQSPYIQSPSKVHCIYHTGSNKCFFVCLVPYTHICLYYFLILYSYFQLVFLTLLATRRILQFTMFDSILLQPSQDKKTPHSPVRKKS